MGLYEDFGEALPQDKREAFRSAISALDGAVKIDSREMLDKLAETNDYVKSWKDAVISKATASHDANFREKTLPGLIEEEIKKRGPKPKDPEVAAALEEAQKARAEVEEWKAATNKARQMNKVLPKITEWGLDPDMAEDFIGNDDASTDAKIAKFEKSFTKARDSYTEKILKERFGNQGMPPKGGSAPTSREALQQKYNELMQKKQFQQALVVQAEMQRLGEK